MFKANNTMIKIISVLLILVFNLNAAMTSSKTFDEQRPENVSDQQWSALKTVVQESKLLPSPAGIGGQNSFYGASVSIVGNRAIVGAPNISGHGSAFVFEYDGSQWAETAIVMPNDGEPNDQFGVSVSLSRNRALIGANYDDDEGEKSGSAYIFELSNGSWLQMAKLTADDGSTEDNLGISVSLSEAQMISSRRVFTIASAAFSMRRREGMPAVSIAKRSISRIALDL